MCPEASSDVESSRSGEVGVRLHSQAHAGGECRNTDELPITTISGRRMLGEQFLGCLTMLVTGVTKTAGLTARGSLCSRELSGTLVCYIYY